ncbi:PREDICTED: anthocyanin 5-aromatic acyltransferase-like [Nelumbo nucifera]|uniref:Anthocyanin 5-aromatic acyltransferase-like n=2 Tax=Nelumbo nucifera TaxID=4432 RepID=A0A1U8ALR6_NELNU|nr:PREDICTED: anthocyanin 5-aromatic acyltransferase-like [Nelumbo nucifera]DAD22481.1 TPA_asm: hypothetical protein HUJ06_023944 [Nelumbo nucifera]
MAAIQSIKVLEKCQVSPPATSIEQKSLQLTFFDVMWLYFRRPSRLLFYEFPHPVILLTESIIPNLKNSLSLALQHFYILAGNLTQLLPSTEPELRYVNGDSISLTIAESSDDFNYLCGHHPRDENRFHPLVPQLPSLSDSQTVPLLAIQVTLFPNSGFSIGITSSHVVADGRSLFHFIRSWATVCRLGGDSPLSSASLPFYDRTVIDDPDGLIKTVWRKEIENLKPNKGKSSSSSSKQSSNSEVVPTESRVPKATFVVSREEIDHLKQWVLARQRKDEDQNVAAPLHLSAFVVMCAVTWVCLIKAGATKDSPNKEMEHFIFSVDCRDRLRDPAVPATYMGNCVAPGYADAKKSDLTGEDGIVIAAKAISDGIKRFEDGLVLRGGEWWISEVNQVILRCREGMVTVAGYPRFGVYEMDFGWGKPNKYETIGMGEGHFSLYDSRDGKGAVEVGLALPALKMEAFSTFFAHSLKVDCNGWGGGDRDWPHQGASTV